MNSASNGRSGGGADTTAIGAAGTSSRKTTRLPASRWISVICSAMAARNVRVPEHAERAEDEQRHVEVAGHADL
jgi:hypothetical protein